jgi:hypothetical protein
LGDDCPLDQLEVELLLGIVTGLRDISLRVWLEGTGRRTGCEVLKSVVDFLRINFPSKPFL